MEFLRRYCPELVCLKEIRLRDGGDPKRAWLSGLVGAGVGPLTALRRIGAYNLSDPDGLAEFRGTFVGARGHAFAHPLDVPVLVPRFLRSLPPLWNECHSILDDLYVASYSIYALTAIHPFPNGNGRTAVDFAQFLLMHRWGVTSPPLVLPKNAHEILGGAFAPIDGECSGASCEPFKNLRDFLLARIDNVSVSGLRELPVFLVATLWLNKSVRGVQNS